MPSLDSHTSASITKLCFIGDSGSGKTAALVSLVAAGYQLRIIDMDNGLDALVQQIRRLCPDKLGSVQYETLRDRFKMSPGGPVIDGIPQAFIKAIGLLDKWSDGSRPSDWGPEYVLVIDSLTFLSNAAMAWAEAVKVKSGPQGKDGRQIYGEAQRAIESVIGGLTSEHFKANVVVISHITYSETDTGQRKGYPMTAGTALGPKLLAYFNSVALCETSGSGTSLRRMVRTLPTSLIDLKNPASFKMAPEMPVETALADFFKTVKGQ